MVSNFSIFTMGLTVFLTLGIPVGLYLFWNKRYSLSVIPLLLGMAVFFAFGVFLLQTLLISLLKLNSDGYSELIGSNPWLYVLYVTIFSGVFIETGRFLAFKLIKKNHHTYAAALSFGIGIGAAEAFFLRGLTMISYISVSLSINSGDIAVPDGDIYMIALIEALINTPSSQFLTESATVIISLISNIALSVVVQASVIHKNMIWLFPSAIILQAVLGIPAALYQAGFLYNTWVVLALMLIPAAMIIFAARSVIITPAITCELIEDTKPDNTL